jgi:hypothetical protein
MIWIEFICCCAWLFKVCFIESKNDKDMLIIFGLVPSWESLNKRIRKGSLHGLLL